MTKNREKAKQYNRKYRYGLTSEDNEKLLIKQNGVCAICLKVEMTKDNKSGKVKALSVDHDHITGKVRGLLCHFCNFILGCSKDNSYILRSAAEYLDNFVKLK